MNVRFPSRLTLLTAALVVLLPTLAVLQYRWAGQLSDAERERMQRNMRNAAGQFRDAFEHEIARAFAALQLDGSIVRDQAWDRYAERYAAWLSTATYPGVVANIYVIDGDGAGVRLRRWNASRRTFERADWNGSLASSRAYFQQELATVRTGERSRRRQPPPAQDDESLLVSPLIHGVGTHFRLLATDTDVPPPPPVDVFGYTVLQLDMPFIRGHLLPQLAERHFTHSEDAAYRAAIVDAADPRRVIYRSSPEAPTDPARADASEMLFNAYGDPLLFLARGGLQQPPGRRPNGSHNVVVSVVRERREGTGSVRTRILGGDGGRWRLLLQHERGSLEAAVTSVRQRNLLVSFGILLLMAVSVGLLTMTSRRAQRLARQQMEFVAGVSHELRTPVAVIRSAAENLSHGVVEDPERVRRYGDAIQAEARRLGEMVERVLQLAGIESGRVPARSPVMVPEIVEGAVQATLAAHPGLTVERHVGSDIPPIFGNADALRSAVENLLGNAAKYGGADGWIGVRVEAHGAGRAREVRVIVEDHGRGIAAADLPHIFEPFYRGADAVARQIQGNGLGLALVRRIVEAHGGRVTVVSREDSGATFTIGVPASIGATPDATSELDLLNEAVAR